MLESTCTRLFSAGLILMTTAWLVSPSNAEPPLLPTKEAKIDPNFSWLEVIRKLPP